VSKEIQGRAIRIGKERPPRADLDQSVIRWLDVINRGKLVVEVDTRTSAGPSARWARSAARRRSG
jgi:hypothetical protein